MSCTDDFDSNIKKAEKLVEDAAKSEIASTLVSQCVTKIYLADEEAEKELAQLQQAYDAELQKMGEEYQLKVTEFVAVQQTLDANIAEARAQEIEQLQQRIQQFRQRAAQSIKEKRIALTAPITEKVTKAIKVVGQKYGYTYIFDLNQAGILFFDPQLCDDVLPLVRAELKF